MSAADQGEAMLILSPDDFSAVKLGEGEVRGIIEGLYHAASRELNG